MRRIIRLVSMAGVVLLVAACGLGDRAAEELVERAAEEAGGGDVDIDADEGGISVEGSEGSLEIGAGTEIPDWFPADFPLPDDHEVFSVVEGEREGRQGGVVAVTSSQSFEELESFFDETLPAAGYEIVERGGFGGDDFSSAYLRVAGGGFEGMLTFQGEASADETVVQVTIGEGDADSG